MAFHPNHPRRTAGAVASTSPGTGWTTVANVQTLINNARAANLPLHLKPGTYTTNKVDVLTSNGGGNPLISSAQAERLLFNWLRFSLTF